MFPSESSLGTHKALINDLSPKSSLIYVETPRMLMDNLPWEKTRLFSPTMIPEVVLCLITLP